MRILWARVGSGASMLIAWADQAVSKEAVEMFAEPEAERLTLHFNAVATGLVLESG